MITIMCVSFLTFFQKKKMEFWKSQNPMFWSKGRRHWGGEVEPHQQKIELRRFDPDRSSSPLHTCTRRGHFADLPDFAKVNLDGNNEPRVSIRPPVPSHSPTRTVCIQQAHCVSQESSECVAVWYRSGRWHGSSEKWVKFPPVCIPVAHSPSAGCRCRSGACCEARPPAQSHVNISTTFPDYLWPLPQHLQKKVWAREATSLKLCNMKLDYTSRLMGVNTCAGTC